MFRFGIRGKFKKILGLPEIPRRRIASYLKRMGCVDLPKRTPGDANTIAIIIPCYRHESYLETTFSCIINQTRKPDHVVFVNDASPDGTEKVLKELIRTCVFSEEIDFSILTNKSNVGQSMSLNRGIQSINDDLIMVLNDDDYLMHDAVEIVANLFSRNQDVFLIGSSNIEFSSDEELASGTKMIQELAPSGLLQLTRHSPNDVVDFRNYNDLNMTHSGSCFLKAAWHAVGGYLPKGRKRVVPFSDRDFQLRLNALFPVAISYEIPFVYWRNNSSFDKGINS
ncbi:MAG: glycosyltransferase [Desulfuromonadales bacterium]|nr:glycosyltransferase [Desulfuromonadales bacterium]